LKNVIIGRTNLFSVPNKMAKESRVSTNSCRATIATEITSSLSQSNFMGKDRCCNFRSINQTDSKHNTKVKENGVCAVYRDIIGNGFGFKDFRESALGVKRVKSADRKYLIKISSEYSNRWLNIFSNFQSSAWKLTIDQKTDLLTLV
jgi:hypothetical protein